MILGGFCVTIVGYFGQILWETLILSVNYFGIKLCETKSDVQYKIIKGLLKGASKWSDQEPVGLVVGYCFIGYIDVLEGGEKFIKIVSTDSFFLKHNFISLSTECIVEPTKEQTLSIWMREGNYHWLRYQCMCIKFVKEPFSCQVNIIDTICEHAEKNINTVVLLYGPSGSGKSMIPMLIAKKIDASLTDSFNPTDPGDQIFRLIDKTKPTVTKKLVIVIEEIDIMILNIHEKRIVSHKNLHTAVKNKESWNSFMDKIDREYYQNIVFIMTSNQTPEYFDNMDKSYMRKGRVDLKIHVKEDNAKID